MSRSRENEPQKTTIHVERRHRKELGLMKEPGESLSDVVDRLLDGHDEAPRNREDPLEVTGQ